MDDPFFGNVRPAAQTVAIDPASSEPETAGEANEVDREERCGSLTDGKRTETQQLPQGSVEALSQAEFVQMLGLIRRHADADMDQWEAWSLRSKWGRVYISITRHGTQLDVYEDLDHLLPKSSDGG